MNDTVGLIIIGCAVVFIMIISIIGSVRAGKKEKARQKIYDNDKDPSQPPKELTQYIKVTVVDQYCGAESIGKRTHNHFTVIFESDTHEMLQYNVPEEMYDCFEKGQTGTLMVVDNYVYSFTLDEV